MKMKIRYICLLFICSLVATIIFPEAGKAMNAEELLQLCESNSAGSTYCLGYISGFYDGRTTKDYNIPEWMSCPPADSSGMKLAVTYNQMVLVFRKWAKDHPEKLHYEHWMALREAFAEAWPCKPKKK